MLGTSIAMSPTFSFAKEYGKFWCKERYLDKRPKPFLEVEEEFARKGYIYALLSSIAMQKDDDEPPIYRDFKLPNYVKKIDHRMTDSGFEAKTFIYKNQETQKNELVIAFTGSNQLIKDWVITNIIGAKKQYQDGQNYVKDMLDREDVKKENFDKVVVTGHSLGGALAGHVAKNPETKEYINEAWLFNPSFRIKSDNYAQEPNFWLGTTTKDIVGWLRFQRFKKIFPSDHQSTDLYLVKSNPIYAHSRWVTTRSILWTADLKYFKDGNPNNPAIKIIEEANFDKACKGKK